MGHEFDSQIDVTRESEGRYAADLSAGWQVGGGVNGGYLLAVMGNAIRASLPDKPDPIAVSAYYLSASTPGAATVTTDVRRDGGSIATVAADLRQGDEARITALATFGSLGSLPDDVRTTAERPPMPEPEECVPNTMAPARGPGDRSAHGPLRHALRPGPRRLGRRRAQRQRCAAARGSA